MDDRSWESRHLSLCVVLHQMTELLDIEMAHYQSIYLINDSKYLFDAWWNMSLRVSRIVPSVDSDSDDGRWYMVLALRSSCNAHLLSNWTSSVWLCGLARSNAVYPCTHKVWSSSAVTPNQHCSHRCPASWCRPLLQLEYPRPQWNHWLQPT